MSNCQETFPVLLSSPVLNSSWIRNEHIVRTLWVHGLQFEQQDIVLFTLLLCICFLLLHNELRLKQHTFIISQFPRVKSPEILSWVHCSGSHKMTIKVPSAGFHSHLQAQLGKNELPASPRLLAKSVPGSCRIEVCAPIGGHSPQAIHSSYWHPLSSGHSQHGCRLHQGPQKRISIALCVFLKSSPDQVMSITLN